MILHLMCWLPLLLWLDSPQSLLCCILVWCVNCFPTLSPPHSSPQSSAFISPLLFPFFISSYPTFIQQSTPLGALWFSLPCLSLPNVLPPVSPPLPPSPLPIYSSLNSVNSSDSRGSSGSHSHSPSSSSSSSSSNHLFHHHHPRHRYRSSTLPQQTPARLSSISSHDSGFISSSQDQYMTSKSSSPMPAETKVRGTRSHPQLTTLRVPRMYACLRQVCENHVRSMIHKLL